MIFVDSFFSFFKIQNLSIFLFFTIFMIVLNRYRPPLKNDSRPLLSQNDGPIRISAKIGYEIFAHISQNWSASSQIITDAN